MTKYKRLSSSGVDMFDPNSEAFRSRCYILKDPETNKDTTANYRINKYFGNKTAECADNCKYEGLDEYGYVLCNCTGLPKGEQKANQVKKEIVIGMPQINFDIVTCVGVTFKYPNIFMNPGFYIAAFFIFMSIIISKCVSKINLHLIDTKLKEIIHNDCVFFDNDELELEQYFDFKKKKDNIRDPNIFLRIRANINPLNPKSSNREDDDVILWYKKLSPLPVGFIDPVNKSITKKENKKEIKGLNQILKKRKKKPKNQKIEPDSITKVENIPHLEGYPHSKKTYFNDVNKNIEIPPKKENLQLTDHSGKNSPHLESVVIKLSPNSINNEIDDSRLKEMKFYTKRYKNIYEKHPDHSPTLKDYEELSPFNAVLCDKRPFKQMFLDNLTDEHVVFELIWRVSILNPLWIRILFFFFNLSINFAMNALFFSDDLIDERTESPESVSISIKLNYLII